MQQTKLVILSTVSLIISIIAISLTLVNFMSFPQSEEGKPSFHIDYPTDFYIFETHTRLCLKNNGTAAATNIKVHVIFYPPIGGPQWATTLYVPKLDADDSTCIDFLIGSCDLNKAYFMEHVKYKAIIHIRCDEFNQNIDEHQTFEFETQYPS